MVHMITAASGTMRIPSLWLIGLACFVYYYYFWYTYGRCSIKYCLKVLQKSFCAEHSGINLSLSGVTGKETALGSLLVVSHYLWA